MSAASHAVAPLTWQSVAIRDLATAAQSMEIAINVTPSGDVRNALTEANIHIMLAHTALKKAYTGSVPTPPTTVSKPD